MKQTSIHGWINDLLATGKALDYGSYPVKCAVTGCVEKIRHVCFESLKGKRDRVCGRGARIFHLCEKHSRCKSLTEIFLDEETRPKEGGAN